MEREVVVVVKFDARLRGGAARAVDRERAPRALVRRLQGQARPLRDGNLLERLAGLEPARLRVVGARREVGAVAEVQDVPEDHGVQPARRRDLDVPAPGALEVPVGERARPREVEVEDVERRRQPPVRLLLQPEAVVVRLEAPGPEAAHVEAVARLRLAELDEHRPERRAARHHPRVRAEAVRPRVAREVEAPLAQQPVVEQLHHEHVGPVPEVAARLEAAAVLVHEPHRGGVRRRARDLPRAREDVRRRVHADDGGRARLAGVQREEPAARAEVQDGAARGGAGPLRPRALALEDRRDGRPDPGAERRVPPRVRHHVEVPPPEAVPVHDRRDALGGRDLEGDPRLRHARRHADRGALRDAHGVDPLDALPPPAARRRPEAELVHQVQLEPERDAVQDAVLAGLERQARLVRRERRLDVRGAEVELGAGHRRRQEPVRARPRLHRAVQVQLLGPRAPPVPVQRREGHAVRRRQPRRERRAEDARARGHDDALGDGEVAPRVAHVGERPPAEEAPVEEVRVQDDDDGRRRRVEDLLDRRLHPLHGVRQAVGREHVPRAGGRPLGKQFTFFSSEIGR